MLEFESVITLFGMPRSGTTILARLISNHSRVRKIIEPYQSRRESKYEVHDLEVLCSDFRTPGESGCSLLIKETATRRDNMRHLSQLMESAANAGHRVGYIFVLRSPLEAFLSQVDASESYWKKKLGFGMSRASLKSFWNIFQGSVEIYLEFAYRFHRRVMFYDAFVREAEPEIARVMGLFAYSLERGQMQLAEDGNFGGDPGAGRATDSFAPRSDRSSAIEKLLSEFRGISEVEKMYAMHEYVKDLSNHGKKSGRIIEDIALLVQMT